MPADITNKINNDVLFWVVCIKLGCNRAVCRMVEHSFNENSDVDAADHRVLIECRRKVLQVIGL